MRPVEVTYILRFDSTDDVPTDADLEYQLECIVISSEEEEV